MIADFTIIVAIMRFIGLGNLLRCTGKHTKFEIKSRFESLIIQEIIPVGHVPSAAVAISEGGVCPEGGFCLGCVCLGGCLARRGVFPGECTPPWTERHTPPPPVNSMTDRQVYIYSLSATTVADGNN